MWLAIIAAIDKLLNIFGIALGWWKEASDETKKERAKQQAIMDESAKKGDFDAWKTARSKRNNA